VTLFDVETLFQGAGALDKGEPEMPARHGFHFHVSDEWMAIAALPFAITVLAVAGAVLCHLIHWS
jgi:hypothetical protein